MSIFPEYTDTEEFNTEIESTLQDSNLPIFREYAINFNTGKLIYENGSNLIVEKNDALKIWIWIVLQITKNKYKIYPSNYGNEFKSLIGKGYSKEFIDAEVQRYLEECLLANPYIKSVENTVVGFEGSKLNIKIRVNSIYGKVEQSV